jgi:uncharacterized membrane protein
MKMVKANIITQLIWLVIAFVAFFVVGLVATRDKTKNKKSNKFTQDGFRSAEMQKVYDHYIQKEMQYGKPRE